MQPGYPQPPPPPQKSNTVAIVLIVIGSVVVLGVVGIVALGALAWSGTQSYVSASKAAEATSTVGQIARDAQAAYETESIDPKTSAIRSHKMCPSASHPVPSNIAAVRGKKYASTPADWTDDSAKNAGFYCLKFEMLFPQYYQYDYRVSGTGSKLGDSFTVEAKGDLDGDGTTSSFSITGTIGGSDMVTLGGMRETDPKE